MPVGSGTVNVVGSHGPPPGDGDAAGDALDEDDPISDPVVVVLAASVDLADAIDDFAEGNAAPEIPHRDGVFFTGDLDSFAHAHDEFIDRVIDDFLKQHVDAVGRIGAVADATDVHAGAQTDVTERIQTLNCRFVVVALGSRHDPSGKGGQAGKPA